MCGGAFLILGFLQCRCQSSSVTSNLKTFDKTWIPILVCRTSSSADASRHGEAQSSLNKDGNYICEGIRRVDPHVSI